MTEAEALALHSFPLVLKPALAVTELDGRLVRGSGVVCADREELERAVARWQGRQPLLAQAHVQGASERGSSAWRTAPGSGPGAPTAASG